MIDINENIEIWKDLNYPGLECFWLISNLGQIKSKKTGKISKQHIRNGYYAASIRNYAIKKSKTLNIHQLVAMTFIGTIPKGYQVNHKNGIKTDNKFENLEIVKPQENTRHAIKHGLLKPHPKKVEQYTMDGEYIQTFNSIIEASVKTNANDRHISTVCKGIRNSCGGYKWKYVDDTGSVISCNGKEINNYPNYQVTSDGKIYSKRAKKYLIPKKLQSGYLTVKLCNNSKMRDMYIHVLVALAFIENPDNKKEVNHKNKNKSDNSIENLEWNTHSENMLHHYATKKSSNTNIN